MIFRTGLGYDVHPLVAGRPLIIGGIKIPYHLGTLGHSDGDALLHAVTDALLGSLALGDIGEHFPDDDPAWKNQPSHIFLEKAASLVKEKGFTIANVDTIVILEKPKLKPFIPEIRENMARILNIGVDMISVKATTHEKMGFAGEEKGWACHALVLVQKEK
jgi:2-C-methyl-D-erythritol 2,4-cyclodiphosphate synthase